MLVPGYLAAWIRVKKENVSNNISVFYYVCDYSKITGTVDLPYHLKLANQLSQTFGGTDFLNNDSLGQITYFSPVGSEAHQYTKNVGNGEWYPRKALTAANAHLIAGDWHDRLSGNQFGNVQKEQFQLKNTSIFKYGGANAISTFPKSNAAVFYFITLTAQRADYTWTWNADGQVNFPNSFSEWDSLKENIKGKFDSSNTFAKTFFANVPYIGIKSPADVLLYSDFLSGQSYPAAGSPPRPRPVPTPPPTPPTPIVEKTEEPQEVAVDTTPPPPDGIQGTGYFDGVDYPITLPTPVAIGTQDADQAVTRANDTKQAASEASFDGDFVYVFECRQHDLRRIMNGGTELTVQGKDVIIKKTATDGYAMPLSYLERRWTYEAAPLSGIFELAGDKTIRISDAGKMLVTVKSKYALYSFLLLPTDKADIPEEGPDPDSPAYQYELANPTT